MAREPFRFDFFQLIYLLEHWERRRASDGRVPDGRVPDGQSFGSETSEFRSIGAKGFPAQPEIGHGGPLAEEGIRLRPDPRLNFSPADIRLARPLEVRPEEADETEGAADWEDLATIERRGLGIYPADEVYRIDVNFMGLYGISAPGPPYFSELINDPVVEKVAHLRSFLDLYNHRLLSFYYRAWQKYRYPYRYQRGAKDEVSRLVLSFGGLREKEVQEKTHLHVPRLIKYLGLLSMRTRPLVGLRLMIADYFRRELAAEETTMAAEGGSLSPSPTAEVRIRPWVLRWVSIPIDEQNRIGERNAFLGENLTLGEETPNRSGKFRVRIGPISYRTYRRFLPNSEKFRQLCALIRLWVGETFDYDIELVIRRQEVPEVQLAGAQLSGAGGLQLGWTGWVTSAPGLDKDPAIIFPKRNTVPKRNTEIPAVQTAGHR